MKQTYIFELKDAIAMTKGFTWKDEKGISETSFAHLQLFLNPARLKTHVGIQKWDCYVLGVPHPKLLWMDAWRPFRVAKMNCFLWQPLYQIPTTNTWQWPNLPQTKDATHSKRCHTQILKMSITILWMP